MNYTLLFCKGSTETSLAYGAAEVKSEAEATKIVEFAKAHDIEMVTGQLLSVDELISSYSSTYQLNPDKVFSSVEDALANAEIIPIGWCEEAGCPRNECVECQQQEH